MYVDLENRVRTLAANIRAFRRAVYPAIRNGLITRTEADQKMDAKFKKAVEDISMELVKYSAAGNMTPYWAARYIVDLQSAKWLDPMKMM